MKMVEIPSRLRVCPECGKLAEGPCETCARWAKVLGEARKMAQPQPSTGTRRLTEKLAMAGGMALVLVLLLLGSAILSGVAIEGVRSLIWLGLAIWRHLG